jgi:CHAD domain-containing protein/CYTH domain-containing protein
MHVPPALPSLVAEEGARRLALAHLQDAKAARRRVVGCYDPEALHDYRVALRRLRSCLRAYRKNLRATVTRKSLRQLRRLARATSASRDLEVHLAWLGEQLDRVGEAERPGVSWMIGRLTAAKSRAREQMLALDGRLFSRVHDRLVSQLSEFQTTIRLDADPRPRSTAAVTAGRVRAASQRLENRLRGIQGYASEAEIHRARIAAKHLRYLLEPFARGRPEVDTVTDRLKGLQDSLGDVHDAHVFVADLREALPEAEVAASGGPDLVPGLLALIASLRGRGLQAFEGAAPAWLGEGAGPFFRQVETLAETIAGLARLGLEIERKFLLTGLPPLEGAEEPVEIEQGYLPGERLIERLRRVRSPEGVELFRTVKEGSGLTRLELEEAVTPGVFAQFWPLTEGRRLRKRRHRIADGNLTWEIDEFLDRHLVLAEVELPGQATEVQIPDWLRPYLDREVTAEDTYTNLRLASNGGREKAD